MVIPSLGRRAFFRRALSLRSLASGPSEESRPRRVERHSLQWRWLRAMRPFRVDFFRTS